MRPVTGRPRGHDWPERLEAFIQSRRRLPFAWGSHDCTSFAADAAIELIGVDPMAPWRGTYTTEDEAEAILAKGGGLEALMVQGAATAGIPECERNFLQRGDIALVEVGNQRAVGIVMAGKVAVPGPDGVHFVPPSMIVRAWAI